MERMGTVTHVVAVHTAARLATATTTTTTIQTSHKAQQQKSLNHRGTLFPTLRL